MDSQTNLTIGMPCLASLPDQEEFAWFCLRSHQKHEHIAAANLAKVEGVTVFNPRFRRRITTRRGLVWITESLFPGYVFARFVLNSMLDKVRYTPSVSSVVHFGDRYPTIPATVISDLRRQFGEVEIEVLSEELAPGAEVTVTEEPFYGMQAIVLRTMPAKARVQVLLEMLGRTTQLEMSMQSVVLDRSNHRRAALQSLK